MKSFRKEMMEPWRADIAAWEQGGWEVAGSKRALLASLVRFNGLRATLIYRLARWADQSHIPLVPSVLTQLNVALHAVELPSSVPVGPGLYMPHTVGTVVTAVSIGRDVTLQSGVTIGQRNGHEYPVIEDGATIGTGAKVLGRVTVGRGSVVGANAVVLSDVPPGCTAVGVPARCLGGERSSSFPESVGADAPVEERALEAVRR